MMKYFTRDQVDEALAFANQGGQALHVYPRLPMAAPGCFKRSDMWGHLYDYDKTRLVATARLLGVYKIVIHHEDTREQHIDLCGSPLTRAINSCVRGE